MNNNLLHRYGNKSKLLPYLLPRFPDNIKIFIDLFMGSGAVSIAMQPFAKYIFANDIDDDVLNLYMVLENESDRKNLEKELERMPVHESLFKYWEKVKETDRIKKALRFLMLSNFSYLGGYVTFRLGAYNTKAILQKKLKDFSVSKIQYLCQDFRTVLPMISVKAKDIGSVFVYADPPYLGTTNNYKQCFTKEDLKSLFKLLVNSGYRFAISEFGSSEVLKLAKKYELTVLLIKDRQTIKSRNTEILIINYDLPAGYKQLSLFDKGKEKN